MPFNSLVAAECFIRRGQLTLIAGGPGTGKSAVTQALLQRGDDHGKLNSVMYFSADSDPFTMYKRAASIATGWEQTEVERMVNEGNHAGLDAEVSTNTAHMRFDYRSAPDEADVLNSLYAYAQVYGAFPEVIVMDNLRNLFIDGVEGEFQALDQATVFLHDLAKDINAAVIGLHHVVGDSENGDKPIPLSGIRGKVTKIPEVCLTLHRKGDVLHVSPVKNRNGKADASGTLSYTLRTDMARMGYTG
ncbi:AAA family ATPase [Glutamicibacter arilaitensis]|uniref:AAA family ATPase n=1 Tax=Glutamicibacter arilaitensis TaxID=256701 RepID=UPI003F90E6D6